MKNGLKWSSKRTGTYSGTAEKIGVTLWESTVEVQGKYWTHSGNIGKILDPQWKYRENTGPTVEVQGKYVLPCGNP